MMNKVFVRNLFLAMAITTCGTAVKGSEAPTFTVATNVMVKMRDGVALATDIYLSGGTIANPPQKLPIVLARTPYNKFGLRRIGAYFATNGYAFVAQDTRGRYASEGDWHMLTDDGPDGFDCAAWIGKQPWSNARIGMLGTSYYGGTQHAMAMTKAPELVTVIPVDAMSNMGRQSMRYAGAFEMRFWNWTLINSARGSSASKDPTVAEALTMMSNNRFNYLRNLPLRAGMTPLRFSPEHEDWLVEAMRHGADDDFWKQNNILDYVEDYKDIPVYLVGGWYDSWAGNTTANFQALTKQLKSPVYLIMGPWIHDCQARYQHGQVTFGTIAAIKDPWAWRREWYDHWLKGIDNSVGKAAPFATRVRIFVMGSGDGSKAADGKLNHGGYWRDENEWPLARAQLSNYYFHNCGTLSTAAPVAQSREQRATSFTFDPDDPVPTIGGCISSGNDILLQGAWNQFGGPHVWNWTNTLPLSVRNDILVFQTEPLTEDVEVTGEIAVKLWISSSAVDTDFTAKLLDVYPPSTDFPGGFDLNIGDGIMRTRFRETLKEEKLMRPGKVYPITIHLYPTSNIFKKGHRIRVDISSSNFPRFDVNPNTGEPLNDNREKFKAVNTIYHDRSRPSHIILPIVKK